jgi:hypothetical protein
MSDKLSDNLSIASSSSFSITSSSSIDSFGEISVCEEIGQLIGRCEDIHENISNSLETLNNINSLIENHNNIIISYNDWTGDFDELLEKLHTETLENIKNGNTLTFGQKLLDTISNSQFI